MLNLCLVQVPRDKSSPNSYISEFLQLLFVFFRFIQGIYSAIVLGMRVFLVLETHSSFDFWCIAVPVFIL